MRVLYASSFCPLFQNTKRENMGPGRDSNYIGLEGMPLAGTPELSTWGNVHIGYVHGLYSAWGARRKMSTQSTLGEPLAEPVTYKSRLHEMTQTTPTCLWNDSAAIGELTYCIEH